MKTYYKLEYVGIKEPVALFMFDGKGDAFRSNVGAKEWEWYLDASLRVESGEADMITEEEALMWLNLE